MTSRRIALRSLALPLAAAAAIFVGSIQTEEWTPLSPRLSSGVLEDHAPGVGTVLEGDEVSGERLERIEIRS